MFVGLNQGMIDHRSLFNKLERLGVSIIIGGLFYNSFNFLYKYTFAYNITHRVSSQ